MKSVNFTTRGGNKIELAIITQKSNLYDNNFMSPCYDLELRINGDLQIGGATKIVINKEHGKCLKQNFGKSMIPIPANKIDAVQGLIDEYSKELDRRINSSIETDSKYFDQSDAVYKMMDSNEDL